MDTTMAKNSSNVQAQPMCSLDYAMADVAAGRINHYSSLEELIKAPE